MSNSVSTTNSSSTVAQSAAAPLPIIHLLRTIGSHLIVWHHLAFYGPVSDVAYAIAPALFDWLVDDARMAVQVFFVVGGFLTARKLSTPRRWTMRVIAEEIVGRYRRIGIPYLAALVGAVLANEVARRAMDHDSISAPPSVTQLFAHALFLQDVLKYEPLTAGIWYLAIDFQLGLLVLTILTLAQRVRGWNPADPEAGFRLTQWICWPLAAASLYWLNRDKDWDVYALYYFGSYFGGMVVAWTIAGRLPKVALAAYAGLMIAAVAIDWRPRLVVALATGLVIFLTEVSHHERQNWSSRVWNFVSYWGERSYSLFLVHFPVCLVVSALFAELVVDRPHAALGVMFGQYVLSLAAAVAFYQFIESRVPRKAWGRRAAT